MESMEEILDLDELQENIIDENLKEFMFKDEQATKLLDEKINEIVTETEKLTTKEEEVSALEESNREKINTNASPDELIEIAEKLRTAQNELSEINSNIERLETEKQELIETKNNIESSKKDYIKKLNSTNLNYQEQINKIEDAIKVCDNPTLKQVLEDVKDEKERELVELQESRNNELKTVLDPIDSSSDENILPVKTEEISNKELVPENEEDTKITKMMDLDSIIAKLDEDSNKIENNIELNPVITDDIVSLDQSPKIKVILEKNVPDESIKEIFSSSAVMESVFNYLKEESILSGGILI